MRRKTSGNTCARPISPTACSKTTPQSSTLASSHGAAFSTSSVASSPSPAVIGLLPVNHSEVWYKLLREVNIVHDSMVCDRDWLVHCSHRSEGMQLRAAAPLNYFLSSSAALRPP